MVYIGIEIRRCRFFLMVPVIACQTSSVTYLNEVASLQKQISSALLFYVISGPVRFTMFCLEGYTIYITESVDNGDSFYCCNKEKLSLLGNILRNTL